MRTANLLALLAIAALARTAPAQEASALVVPTKEHAEMAREVGVWDAEMSLWPAPDAAEPMSNKAVETVEMMGKFWLIAKFDGELMGEKFEGRSQMTYDPLKKQYIGTWIDTMSAVILNSAGTYDPQTHTLTMMMEGIDGMTGQPGKWKSITRYVDNDHKTFEMHAPVEGKEGEWWKMMEIKYTRKK